MESALLPPSATNECELAGLACLLGCHRICINQLNRDSRVDQQCAYFLLASLGAYRPVRAGTNSSGVNEQLPDRSCLKTDHKPREMGLRTRYRQLADLADLGQ